MKNKRINCFRFSIPVVSLFVSSTRRRPSRPCGGHAAYNCKYRCFHFLLLEISRSRQELLPLLLRCSCTSTDSFNACPVSLTPGPPLLLYICCCSQGGHPLQRGEVLILPAFQRLTCCSSAWIAHSKAC